MNDFRDAVLEQVTPHTPTERQAEQNQRHRAALYICSKATGPADAALLLDALGLTPRRTP